MRERGTLARFKGYKADPSAVSGLSLDHPAVTQGRTLFLKNVTATADSVRFLIGGENNAKIGKVVTKGEWAGFPIFTLTLEERATCPRSCALWRDCYGNAMHWPKRWDHRDPAFMPTLREEIEWLSRKNPAGLVIRLHILGDFFSFEYAKLWAEMIDTFPQLHVYGYTARRPDADDAESREIAKGLQRLKEAAWDQFALRFSHETPGPGRSVVFDADPQRPDVIMCPAQPEKTATCGTCGLCWAEAARDKTIGFLRHGMKPGRRKAAAAPLPAPTAETRLASIADVERWRIEQTYGVKFR